MSEAQARSKRFNPLDTHSSTQPEKTAVIGPERALTYGQLRERARALASRLYELGLRPGDQAAVMTYNLPEYDEISKALQYLQVGLVMVGYRTKPPQIQFIVENSDSKLLFIWHEFAERILPFRDDYGTFHPEGFVVFGGSADPFAAWLLLRGLRTLHVRMAAHEAGATAVARALEAHPHVRRVLYPGLPSHPRHALACRQMRNFGGMVCFELDGFEAARAIFDSSCLLSSASLSMRSRSALIFFA